MTWFVSDIPTSLTVEELVVRRYQLSDAPQLVASVTKSLPELLQWMPWAKFEPQSVKQREDLIRQWTRAWDEKSDFTMGIFDGDTCVGGTGFHLRGEIGELEIGYWVSSERTKQGIATRVASALVDVAFNCPEVDLVTIAHDAANTNSERVPERLGFRMTREYRREPEAPSEMGLARVWVVTRDEWMSR